MLTQINKSDAVWRKCKSLVGGTALITAAAISAPAEAAVVLYAWDNAGDVLLLWSGSLDLEGLSSATVLDGSDQVINVASGTITLYNGTIQSGVNRSVKAYGLSSFTQPEGANPGSFLPEDKADVDPLTASYFFDNSAVGSASSNFSISMSQFGVAVQRTYVNGSEFSGTGTIENTTLEDMQVLTGTYRYNIANSAEFIEVRMGEAPAPVPVPPALGLMAASLVGLGLIGRRRKP